MPQRKLWIVYSKWVENDKPYETFWACDTEIAALEFMQEELTTPGTSCQLQTTEIDFD